MRLIRRIWRDFKKGENIDLYVTVVVAIIVSAMNIAGFVPQEWLTPLILAVLALLSVSILGNRYRIENIQEAVSADRSVLLTEFSDEFIDDFVKSKHVLIIGADLNLLLKRYYPRFIEKLVRGDTVNILLLNPNSQACEIAAVFHYEPMSAEDKRAVIRRSVSMCKELKTTTSGNLELRLTDVSLPFGSLVTDPKTTEGKIYVWFHSFKAIAANAPKIVVKLEDRYWYNFFKGQIDAMWSGGTRTEL